MVLLKERLSTNLWMSWALTLTAWQSLAIGDSQAWKSSNLIQNKMVFRDTSFFSLVIEINRLEDTGFNCSILLRYCLIALIKQSNISFVSIHKVSQRWYSEFLKAWIIYKKILSLGHGVWGEKRKYKTSNPSSAWLNKGGHAVHQLFQPTWELIDNKFFMLYVYLQITSRAQMADE